MTQKIAFTVGTVNKAPFDEKMFYEKLAESINKYVAKHGSIQDAVIKNIYENRQSKETTSNR